MPVAQVNGQKIHYHDTGGSGPAVVLSHGFLMDRTMFDAQVEVLAPKYRVITWDERGFGDTEYDGKPFTYWDSARDCLGLMDHLGLSRAVLGGMSQGGFLSLRAALTSPERVTALVLIDTAADNDGPEVLAGYRQMVDTWLSVGPVDDLVNIIATSLSLIQKKIRSGLPSGRLDRKNFYFTPRVAYWNAMTSPLVSGRSPVLR